VALKLPDMSKVERMVSNTAGADWGLENVMTFDDGRLFETLAPNKRYQAEIRRRQIGIQPSLSANAGSESAVRI